MRLFLLNHLAILILILHNLNASPPGPILQCKVYEIENDIEIIQPNSIHCSIKFFFDGTNQLLAEHHPITGINYLLDSISSFFLVCSEKNGVDNNVKNQILELIIRLKYHITVLINTYFKLYKASKAFTLSVAQKKIIAQSVKSMFKSLITIPVCPVEIRDHFNEYLCKLMDVIFTIFSPPDASKEVLDLNKHMFINLDQIFKSLNEKCQSIKLNKNECYIIDSKIVDGLCLIFNNVVDLSIEFEINFEYLKDTIAGLLNIILTNFSDETKKTI